MSLTNCTTYVTTVRGRRSATGGQDRVLGRTAATGRDQGLCPVQGHVQGSKRHAVRLELPMPITIQSTVEKGESWSVRGVITVGCVAMPENNLCSKQSSRHSVTAVFVVVLVA